MKTKAIIIKKTNTNEYDQLVTCYTEESGKLTTIAKSILKPKSVQAMHLDELNLVEFELINGRAIPIITGAQAIEHYLNIKQSVAKFAAAEFFAEVIDKMVFEKEKDDKFWNFITSALHDINNSDDAGLTKCLREKQSELLNILGYAPEISRCVLCSTDMRQEQNKLAALSPEAGGIVCEKCFLAGGSGVIFKADELAALSKGRTGVDYFRAGARSPLDNFFEYMAGQRFRSLDFFYSVVK